MSTKTTIHAEGHHNDQLYVEYDQKFPNSMFLHVGSGGFSFCTSFDHVECRQLAEALMKGAFAIEAQLPQLAPEAA